MKKRLIKLSASVVVFVFAIVLTSAGVEKTYAAAAFFVAYAIAGIKVIYKAIRNIRYGKVFDENFLMTVASVGAFIIGEYPEAAAVMIFYRFGELFEDYAVGKSRKSIAELMNIRPDCANLKTAEGAKKVSPEEVSVGDVIIVGPGEKIPLDGVVVSGISNLDTAALTGESLPRMAEEGDEVLSGCINLTGLLEIRVTKQFSESTVNKILDLVENATSKKAKTENFITRFAAVYTPAVVIGAALLALLPPLVIEGAQFSDWGYRALNFLVVSCPCALVISVPLGFFGGIGAASKAGILVKGSNYLEAISKTECVVLDKTGTLTKGIFEVEKIEPSEYFDENKVLEYAAIAEQKSVHPISVSLQKAWQQITAKPLASIDKLQEFAGKGVCAVAGDDAILAGNMKLMQEQGISDIAENMVTADYSGTIVYVAVNGKYAGKIMIADAIKEDSQATLSALHSASIDTVMLSGDSCAAAEAAAAALGVGRVAAELLPADKVSLVEQLMEEKRSNGKLVFIGDGINDAPVLARADIGIAMGGLGSDAAIEAADIVIMDDKPSKLLTLIKISQKTMSIVKQNIIFALGIKLLVLLISAAGYGNLWAAVFADVGVSVIAILNSLRVLSNRY